MLASPRREDALVAGLALAALALFWAVSWGAWPLLTADSARELYVPFQIRHGALIYRDFAYLYGPVAPYLAAGLLALFGEHLQVLYVASALSLAATVGLLYTLARQVLPPWPSGAVLWIFLTHFALGQDIWGYMWPYAFAATDGVLEGLGLLVALVRHAKTGHRAWLVPAGVAMGLSLVTKLEYGLAAGLTVALYGGLRALARPGWKPWTLDALAALLPGLAVAGGVAAAVLSRMPWATVRESVWPVALMKLWNSQGTWHGTLASWRWNLTWLGLAIGVMAIAWTHRRAWESLKSGRPWGAIALLAALGVLAVFGRFYLQTADLYWMGPGFLVLFGVVGVSAARLWTDFRRGEAPSPEWVAWTLLGAYGCLVATRTLMTGYNDYMRYQAPVALVAWVALAVRWLPGWWGGLDEARPVALGLLAGVVGVLGVQNAARELSGYLAPHAAVSGPAGTVLADPGFAGPYNQALGYVRAHLRPGEAIVAAPMEASFYLFTGVDNVLHEDQLFWGYLTTDAEQQAAIRRLEARHVRYVLVSDYGQDLHVFGRDYMPLLGGYLRDRCQVVGDYASTKYRVRVYATPSAAETMGM